MGFTVHGEMLLHPTGSGTRMHFVSISNKHLLLKSVALSSTQKIQSKNETFHAAPKTMLQIPLSVATRSVKKNFFVLFENFVNYLCISGLKSFSCFAFVILLC